MVCGGWGRVTGCEGAEEAGLRSSGGSFFGFALKFFLNFLNFFQFFFEFVSEFILENFGILGCFMGCEGVEEAAMNKKSRF